MRAFKTLRDFIELLETDKQLLRITDAVSLEPDLAAAGRTVTRRSRSSRSNPLSTARWWPGSWIKGAPSYYTSRDPALANPARQYLPGIARIIEASRLSLWTWQLQPERPLRERAP
jgi:hypothetical protein